MIKVTIKNLSDVQIAGAEFETQEQADAWIAEQKAHQEKCLWGKPAYVESVPVLDENDEPVLDEQGLPTFQEVAHEDEFTIEMEDLGDAPAWEAIRQKRNALLAECDYTQLADSPLDSTAKAQYATYRQALRDLTEAATPEEVVFPTKP